MTENNSDNRPNPQFALQKIYVKDLSFESPRSGELFTASQTVIPEINLQMNTESHKVKDGIYEVVLTITITAKEAKKEVTFYLIELKQAGIFTLQNFPDRELNAVINSLCPNILFPYAREAISSIVERGGFPQLLLAPINFDALYQQYIAELQKANAQAAETNKTNGG